LASEETKDAVLNFLLECDTVDALWVLDTLSSQRPALIMHMLANKKTFEAPPPATETVSFFVESPKEVNGLSGHMLAIEKSVGRNNLVNKELQPTKGESRRSVVGCTTNANWRTKPIVQFSCFIYYCDEAEEYMKLDVMRIGNQDEVSRVNFATRDGSAMAGIQYQAMSGTLEFKPGVSELSIYIPLLNTSAWENITEFGVDLSAEGLENALLGRYTWTCRVKRIDDSFFPSNRYSDQISRKAIEEIPQFALLWEYFKFNFDNWFIKVGTIKRFFSVQVHNVYFLMQLFTNTFIVDEVLNGGENEARELCLLAVMMCWTLPVFLMHYLDYSSLNFGVSSTSRYLLQHNILCRYMHYDATTLVHVPESDLLSALTRDSYGAVHEGYMNIFKLAELGGRLVMVVVYQLAAPYLLKKPFSVLGLAPALLFPCVMLVFLAIRNDQTVRLLVDFALVEDKFAHSVQEIVANYRLIADYNQRPKFLERADVFIRGYSEARRNTRQVLLNSSYFAQWLTTLWIASYLFIGGTMVLEREQSLGMFLTNIRIFKEIGDTCGTFYQVCLEMATVFPKLDRVVTFLNWKTDVDHRMKLNRSRRAKTHKMRKQLSEVYGNDGYNFMDVLPICAENFTFEYEGFDPQHCTTIQLTGRIDIPQGHFVCLMGAPGHGKSSLLKVLGGAILPQLNQAEIESGESTSSFVPDHLRVLHVAPFPCFFSGTLYENLTFGLKQGDVDAHPDRVRAICRSLCISSRVLRFVESDAVYVWGHVLSHTELHLLTVARALITNPEVLCMHKPTQPFSDKEAKCVMTLLKDFVINRGVEQDQYVNQRRPRTCIITSSASSEDIHKSLHAGEELCDLYFNVGGETGIEKLDPSEARNSVLE